MTERFWQCQKNWLADQFSEGTTR